MRGWTALITMAGALTATAAEATYSPPLTRVRIDEDRVTHTPELMLASDLRAEATFRADARVLGAQYLLQLERATGWGLQLGAAVGHASVDVNAGAERFDGVDALFLGGQARGYLTLWSGGGDRRPHALTAFVNLRVAHYRAPDGTLTATALGAGLGAMAELSLTDHVSLCPYAWLTPGLFSSYTFSGVGGAGPIDRASEAGPGLRTPLQFGLDVWLYPFGAASADHLSLSVIASLIDTSDRGSRTVSGVLGWTF